MTPPKRPIKKLLVANRGEIAVRILQAARELPNPIATYAIYTSADSSHATHAHHAIAVPSPSTYMDISALIAIVKQHGIDAVHPGYGFLSESHDFARRMREEAGAVVVGPGAEILAATGDKLLAKDLARESSVPVLESVEANTMSEIEVFIQKVGYPVMVKAVDGGGGRGIRLVESKEGLKTAVDRARGESPSGKVFMEKAAVGGFHHVEVQVIGDGEGEVRHLWERDCSVQRRYQKIVEVAPAMIRNRKLVGKVIEAALEMARKASLSAFRYESRSHILQIQYLSLGTFEFLVSESTSEFFFLEVNPRLQVEHTITECIASFDLVEAQLGLAQGHSMKDVGLGNMLQPESPPSSSSIQLRLCAEDPSANFALSIGKITEFHVPTGNGIRIETNISTPPAVVIGSDFDNLLAKVIVTASDWKATVRKARRALEDVRIVGVKTNIDLLRGIIGSPDFESGNIDTRWLESNIEVILKTGQAASSSIQSTRSLLPVTTETSTALIPANSTFLFRKGDAWSITLSPTSENKSKADSVPHHLKVAKILRNDFPNSLAAEIEYTAPPSSTRNFEMLLESNSGGAVGLSSHRMGDLANPNQICIPMAGKLIEVLVEEGDIVEEDAVVAFVKQMKMELEVRSPRRGRVVWTLELEEEDGEDVREGTLLAEIEQVEDVQGKVEMRGKL